MSLAAGSAHNIRPQSKHVHIARIARACAALMPSLPKSRRSCSNKVRIKVMAPLMALSSSVKTCGKLDGKVHREAWPLRLTAIRDRNLFFSGTPAGTDISTGSLQRHLIAAGGGCRQSASGLTAGTGTSP